MKTFGTWPARRRGLLLVVAAWLLVLVGLLVAALTIAH